MRTCSILVVALVFTNPLRLTAADDPKTIDLAALAQAGAETQQKLQSQPASWNVHNTLQSGTLIHVSVLRAGDKQRMVFDVDNGGQRVEVFRVISRDGLWYVTDRNGSYKFRPFEAPTETPFIYMTMLRSDPLLVTSPDQLSTAKFDRVEGRVAHFRDTLPPAQVAQLKGLIEQMETLARESGKPLAPELAKQQEMLKDLLANGMPTLVDLATGRLIEFGAQKLRTRVTDFRFLPQIDDAEFAIADREWQDNSDDPTTGNLDDLTMITHQPLLQPGQKNYDTDGRLMDVKTGRFRRLPFPGGVVTPGCFLADRRSVIVCGLESETGTLRPYQIDLKTCQCDPLGSPLLDSGQTLWADLSPDGKTIAVSHLDSSAGLLKIQICLVDLATRTATPLGEPLDTSKAFWTADGMHLMMLSHIQGFELLVHQFAGDDGHGRQAQRAAQRELAGAAGRPQDNFVSRRRNQFVEHLRPGGRERQAVCRRAQGLWLSGAGARRQAHSDDVFHSRKIARARRFARGRIGRPYDYAC